MILDPLIMRPVYSPVSYAFVFVKHPFLYSENKYSNKKAEANVTTSVYFHMDLILIAMNAWFRKRAMHL